MKARMTPTALVGILSALGAASAAAQSSAPAPAAAPVTPAVTVVAQRVPVVTVLAPRETPSGVAADKRQQTPANVGKAVDADGDGLADAPAPPARAARSGPAADKGATPPPAAPRADCGEKEPRTAPASSCAKGSPNPLYRDTPAQGSNPLHD